MNPKAGFKREENSEARESLGGNPSKMSVCVCMENDAARFIRQDKGEAWMAIWKMTVMGFYCR